MRLLFRYINNNREITAVHSSLSISPIDSSLPAQPQWQLFTVGSVRTCLPAKTRLAASNRHILDVVHIAHGQPQDLPSPRHFHCRDDLALHSWERVSARNPSTLLLLSCSSKPRALVVRPAELPPVETEFEAAAAQEQIFQ